MRATIVGLLFVTIIGARQIVFAESIRVLGDRAGGMVVAIPPVPATANIIFGSGETSITGAEFKVEGLPRGWIGGISSSAATAVVGEPFNNIGINLAFEECQSLPTKLLCEVSILATSLVFDVVLRVVARTPPGNQYFDCPLVTLCDAPAFTKLCVQGSATCVNPLNINCYETVRDATWTSIKKLYR